MNRLLLSFILLFGFLLGSSASAETKLYSEFIIREAIKNLPSYFDHFFEAYTFNEKDSARFKAIREVVNKYAADPQKYVQFRDGGDPIFKLKPGEPERMAVTGLDIETPVYFNLGLIGAKFTYADALALWFHELGHKTKLKFPDFTQAEIDNEAKNLGGYYGSVAKLYDVSGKKILAINPVPSEGAYFERQNFVLAEITDGKANDVSAELHAALDKALPGYLRYTESQRKVQDLFAIDGATLGFSLRTGRIPKDLMKMYLESDAGGGHYMNLALRWPGLEVVSYEGAERPPPIVNDGVIRIAEGSLQISDRTISGRFEFELQNLTYYHASNYPWDTTEVIALVDGLPRHLPVKLRYAMDDPAGYPRGWMPHEAFEKLQRYGAYFSIETEGLNGRKVVLQSLISKFFRFRDYDPVQDQMKQIRLATAVPIDWAKAAGCDQALTGGPFAFSIEKLIADGI